MQTAVGNFGQRCPQCGKDVKRVKVETVPTPGKPYAPRVKHIYLPCKCEVTKG